MVVTRQAECRLYSILLKSERGQQASKQTQIKDTPDVSQSCIVDLG